MNPGSRKRGIGARAPKPPKEPEYRDPVKRTGDALAPVSVDPKTTEALRKARAKAIAGLSELVGLSLATLGDCLRNGPSRAQGSRSSDARYVLDVVLERITAPGVGDDDDATDEDGNPTPTPIDELAERRAELQRYIRIQRREMEKSKR